jgi:rhamnosyltransferase
MQNFRPAQIIVVDSGSWDKTVEIAESKNCRVIKIKREEFDHGTTRNLAVAQTDGQFVIFLTQDVLPADENMLAELIKPIQADENIAICYGRQLPHPNTKALEKFAREFNYPPVSAKKTKDDIKTLGLKTFFCSNSCSAVKRETFDKLGGFKNNVIVNEDMLFAAEAISKGYAVYYNAAAKVYHGHNYYLHHIFKRYFKIGRFFADNRWLLEKAPLKGYGGNMLKAGLKYFWKKRAPLQIIALVADFVIKSTACKLGWYYQLMCKRKQVKIQITRDKS